MIDRYRQRDARKSEKEASRQTKEKEESMKGWMVLIVTVGLILAVVFGCRIKTIRITGNERVSDETIQTLIQYDKCQNNSLLLWLLNRKTDISSEPLLNSIHVQLRNPQTIVVQVNEEKLSGYVQSEDEYIYVNDSGKIVLKQTEKLQDVLLLSGITADTAEVGEQLVSDDTGVFADFWILQLFFEAKRLLQIVLASQMTAAIILSWARLRFFSAKIYIWKKRFLN